MVSESRNIPVLVIGASGFVGCHVLAGLRQQGYFAVGTQSTAQCPGLLRFNLVQDRIGSVISSAFDNAPTPGYALLCAGIGSVEACSQDRVGSRLVNVTSTKRLIDDLTERGFSTIYFSTSAVFDGHRLIYDESILPAPLHEYGRQKAEVEDFLLSQVPDAVVVRLSKIVDTDPAGHDLLGDWWKRVRARQPIECVAGESFSPTLAADVAAAIGRLIDRRLSGLFHVANSEGLFRDDMARQFLAALGGNSPVVPVVNHPPAHFGFTEPRPACSCLCSEKLVRATGTQFRPVAEILRTFCNRLRDASHGH